MTILYQFVDMLIDPIRFCIAFSFAFVGYRSKQLTRGHWIALATAATVFVVETPLYLTQNERQVFPTLIVAVAACLCHVLLAMWILRQVARWREKRAK